MTLNAAILDAASLGEDVDLSPLGDLVNLSVYPTTAPDQTAERLQGCQVVFTNKVVIDEPVMAQCPDLQLISVLATGMNNVDLETAHKRGIVVSNAVAYGTDSVAQHTLMLMLMLATQQTRYAREVQKGAWSDSPYFCLMNYPVVELRGRKLVIVGEGTLGKAVARLAECLGMSVVFSARPGQENSDHRPALNALLPDADLLSLHCPLTDSTRNLVDQALLELAKPNLLVVNCARGGIVNEIDMLDALRQGRVAGFATDVAAIEPPPTDYPLLKAMDEDLNLVVTPHNAWISKTARQAIVSQAADAVRRLLL